MNTEKIERGFVISKFNDAIGTECSIQQKKNANDNCIWLGVDKPDLIIFENENKYVKTPLPEGWVVNSYMLLSVDHAKDLLSVLERFIKNGCL